MNDNEKVADFLSTQQFMVVAVTLEDGTPWAVPVRIVAREGMSFEWDSKLDTVHSQALKMHPDMAITIFQKFDDSQIVFYAKGHGELVNSRDDDFGRYRFTATQCWLNDETFRKREVSI